MGFPMAGHLSKLKSIDFFVHNRSQSVTKRWLKKYKASPLFNLDKSEIKFDGVLTCLKDDAAITNTLVDSGLIQNIKKGGFIIDHSTSSVEFVKSILKNETVKLHNISFFDAPVSGGEAGAINGKLSVMLGGPKTRLSHAKSLMTVYSKQITHIGPNSHGQLSKMVNQLCIAGLVQGLSEGIALGKKSQLDMSKVFEAISGGAAQSWQMDNRFKTMVDSKFDFGFAVDLMIKDLNIALKRADSLKVDAAIAKKVLTRYKKLSKEGGGSLDTSSLIKLLSK